MGTWTMRVPEAPTRPFIDEPSSSCLSGFRWPASTSQLRDSSCLRPQCLGIWWFWAGLVVLGFKFFRTWAPVTDLPILDRVGCLCPCYEFRIQQTYGCDREGSVVNGSTFVHGRGSPVVGYIAAVQLKPLPAGRTFSIERVHWALCVSVHRRANLRPLPAVVAPSGNIPLSQRWGAPATCLQRGLLWGGHRHACSSWYSYVFVTRLACDVDN